MSWKFIITPNKVNVVTDALSQKAHHHCLRVEPGNATLCDDLGWLGLEMILDGFLTNLEIKSTLLDDIKVAQKDDKGMARIREKMKIGQALWFFEDEQGILWFGNRLMVLKVAALRKKILMRLMTRCCLFILAARRCIKT